MSNPFDDAPPEIRDLAFFASELRKESDRGAVLISAARCDEVLFRVIRAFLCAIPQSEALLDGPNAPLGTFSARINAALALGLIQQDEFHDLNLIRKVRNEFGHSWKDVNFDTQKIADLCLDLPWLGPKDAENQSQPKSRFTMNVCMLLTDLLWREQLVNREKRSQKTWGYRMRI